MNNDQFLEDVEQGSMMPSDEQLDKVRTLVEQQVTLEDEVKDLEKKLEEKKAALANVREVQLPSALQEFGLSEIKLTDGSKVNVKQEYYATIKEEFRPAAFAWLERNGHSDLIKHDVIMSFTRGQDEYARQAMELLQENNFTFDDKRNVHPQTLKAFVKEQIEAGREIPLDTFSVHIKQVAKIHKEKK